ncbi:ANTAR domain-containing protein [Streptomyces sp. NPDC005236]|uniref:ANTAR domain-containing protein n=1 Tax=Streptomyces sp. NPDC005236 TaxID=3157028 RepID=UPI00339EF7D1
MSQETVTPRGGHREPNATLRVRRVTDGVDVLCLSGILDTEGATALARELASRLRATVPEQRRLILDLTGLRLLSAAGIRVLDTHTRHLSDNPVLVIAATPHVQEIFTLAPAPGLRVHPTLDAALAALPDTTPHGLRGPRGLRGSGATAEADEDRSDEDRSDQEADQDQSDQEQDQSEDVLGLRAKARTSAVIGMAQGILLERYALADFQAAFELMCQASQHHNVPLRILASAVVTAPSPTERSRDWFPGRLRTPPPSWDLLDTLEQGAYDRRRLLRTFVGEVVTITCADGAEVHLVDRALRALVLESHAGLDAAYRDHVAHVNGTPALCARARLLEQPVLVADILADAALATADEGRAALAAGSRALYAVPALAQDGACVGVITVHHARPGPWLTPVQRTALQTLTDDLARWRSWYRRTVVLDALEYLHAHA